MLHLSAPLNLLASHTYASCVLNLASVPTGFVEEQRRCGVPFRENFNSEKGFSFICRQCHNTCVNLHLIIFTLPSNYAVRQPIY